MSEIVNIVTKIQKEIQKAGVSLTLNVERLLVTGPAGSHSLRLVRLYRPSSADVERAAAPDALLVLSAATQKAVEAAAPFNHILVPEGGYRLVLPGVALVRDAPVSPETARQVRLMGRTGVLAESLLLGGERAWAVQELAANAQVSMTLAHRVLTRLEREGLLLSKGLGPAKRRQVVNAKALAELWSQEEKPPKVALRGYLYSSSTEALAKRILELYPGAAVGGTLAANLYQPTLTKVAPPLRVWVPGDFDPDRLKDAGFQQTGEGANLELLQSKDDPWRVHRSLDEVSRVSGWRAWLEVANVEGRTKELADALLMNLVGE